MGVTLEPTVLNTTIHSKWRETIDSARTDSRWHGYDSQIHRVLSEYSAHLHRERGYCPLDWRLIKAMIWTESGGPTNRAWSTRPMQIGNPGDPGLRALLHGNEGGDIILPPSYRSHLTMANAVTSAELNIRAGVGYLLMRLAKFKFQSVVSDSDKKMYEVTAHTGDSFAKIFAKEGTTMEVLRSRNPTVSTLRPGQILRYQKAAVRRVIVGWQPATPEVVARIYNVGDPQYANKLRYCLSVMQLIERGK